MKILLKCGSALRGLSRAKYIQLPLRSRASRVTLIMIAAVPALMLSLQATRIALAARSGSCLDVQGLRQAIKLDPGNAVFDHELGLVYAYSFGQANLPAAVELLRRATELNPRKAIYWSDLAEVCDTIGDTACSNRAIERTLKLSPMTPRFEWKAGNHYLQTGQTEQAMNHFRRLLELDDTYAQPVFQVCLRVAGNLQSVLQEVFPREHKPQLDFAYLDFVSEQGDIDLANQIWSGLSSEGVTCKFSDVKPYLSRLIAQNNTQQAATVWHELERRGVVPRPEPGGAKNLVYNGGFEHSPLNAGFDWRAPNTPFVETDFRDPSACGGSHCLRVDYAPGRNMESDPVYELIPVVPGVSYELQVHVRSDDIRSGSGPRLRVIDPACPACLSVSTSETVGTTAWHLLTLNFTAGADTRIIRLSVWRPRSREFPMEISGSFRVDDVSITPLKTPAEKMGSLQ